MQQSACHEESEGLQHDHGDGSGIQGSHQRLLADDNACERQCAVLCPNSPRVCGEHSEDNAVVGYSDQLDRTEIAEHPHHKRYAEDSGHIRRKRVRHSREGQLSNGIGLYPLLDGDYPSENVEAAAGGELANGTSDGHNYVQHEIQAHHSAGQLQYELELEPQQQYGDIRGQVDNTGRASTEAKKTKKKKKSKQVVIQLDPLAHQRLMKVVADQYGGSLEMFVNTAVNAKMAPDSSSRKASMRKPTLTKWKRMKFEQLKGNETQELAMAFQSLAESTAGIEVPCELLETPWQELTMAHFEKMLEQTKKMLLLNDKAHDCPHLGCDKRFATPGNLRDHLNEHSGERPYICDFDGCTLQFTSKQLLCRHTKKHERAHKCTFEGCNKRFAFRERLIVHQKTHCDDRPLLCPYEGCGKSFKWVNSLNGHLRTHTGEKKFHCEFIGCGRSFGYKVDLTRHVRTHYGQHARSTPR